MLTCSWLTYVFYLIYDIGTKNGLLHVFLIRFDDTLDVVDNLLDFRRQTAARMFQELGHQYFGVFVHLQVSEGVWAFVGGVCVHGSWFKVDINFPALLLLLPDTYVTGFCSNSIC